jgi:glutamate synthase (NADPH/NADH) small chain
MPAYAYEYEYMKQDGVHFEWYAQPTRIMERDGVAVGVEFVRTEITDPASRRGRLTEVPGSEFTVEADMIVKALGQDPVRELVEEIPDLRVEKGRIVVDAATCATSVKKLYAGGDCLSGGAEIVNAVEEGKIAATSIDRAIRGS